RADDERGRGAARRVRDERERGRMSSTTPDAHEARTSRIPLDLRVVREYGVVVAFVALFIVLALSSDVFFTEQNMKNLLFQTAPVGIIAAGGTLVFIAGGFDLSVGAISGYAGITAAQAYNSLGVGIWASMILGALTGLGFGVANGLLITIGKVNAFM